MIDREYYALALEMAAVAEDAWRSEPHNYLAREASEHAWRAVLVVALMIYGRTCPTCRGAGEVVSGRLAATMTSPAEDIIRNCPDCRGRGRVLGLSLPPASAVPMVAAGPLTDDEVDPWGELER